MQFVRPFFAFQLILTAFVAVYADTVHLTNGDTITGSITGFSDGAVVVTTDYAGEIRIRSEHVRWVETDGELMVIYPDRPPQRVEDGEARDLDLSDAEYIGPPLPIEPVHEAVWEGALDAQIALRTGESETYDAIAGIEVTRHKQERVLNAVHPISRLILSLSGAYGESDGELDTQRVDAEQRYRYYVQPRLYLLQLTAFRHDDTRDLDYRATAGLGLGYDIVRAERRSLSVDGALTYDYEQWEEDGDAPDRTRREDHINLLATLEYEERFTSGAILGNTLELVPRLDDPGEVRLMNTFTVAVPVSTRTFVRFEWRSEYDSDPAAGIDEWDHLLTSGVRYTF